MRQVNSWESIRQVRFDKLHMVQNESVVQVATQMQMANPKLNGVAWFQHSTDCCHLSYIGVPLMPGPQASRRKLRNKNAATVEWITAGCFHPGGWMKFPVAGNLLTLTKFVMVRSKTTWDKSKVSGTFLERPGRWSKG